MRVGVDDLFDVAKDERLLTELRGGRSEQGARTALGMALASWRDQRVGPRVIRHVGAMHGGGAAYRLEEAP